MNQALAFGLLLAGGVLVEAAIHGHHKTGPASISDVLAGRLSPLNKAANGGGGSPFSGINSTAGYVDPFARAQVTVGRTDQGVDLTGTGPILALGPGRVTTVYPAGSGASGWPGGGYVEYQLTGGPLDGALVYVAEGIRPLVQAGERIAAGQPIAEFIPGAPTGIETGFGSGVGTTSYAMQHGGYSEGQATAAGQAFRELLQELGLG
jgi:hypothetical protein